jgi:hypothetical protein
MSPKVIHWESQSNTSENSNTGIRYQNHDRLGSSIMLFARENTNHREFWFLGSAHYISHESERPMQIKWMLDHPIPGDLFPLLASVTV